MRTFLVGLVSSLVALAGLAGSASASATVDLIWQGSGTDTTSGLTISDTITLDIMLTAGALGSNGGSVSLDYSAVVGSLSVTGFTNTLDGYWGLSPAGAPTNPGDGIIHHINAGSICGVLGSCLANGETQRIGTVTFHVDALPGGSVTLVAGLFDALDGVGNAVGGDANPSFNDGFAVVPEPSTLSLLGMGLGGLYGVGRRMRPKR
jgi:PEP-CTERM motif